MTPIIGFGTAFLLGAFHALEPGHGKTLITAFMLGNSGSIWHVLTLGLSLAFSHTLVLIFLGFGLNYFLHQSVSEIFTGYIEIASAVMVIGLGGFMIYQSKIAKKKHECCDHDHNGHNHDYHNDHSHKDESKASHRLTAIAGFTSGLLPCPSALGAFFMSGTSGGLQHSIWFILVYVSGLVIALMLLAYLVQFAKSTFEKSWKFSWLTQNASFLSALIITATGIVYLSVHLLHIHS